MSHGSEDVRLSPPPEPIAIIGIGCRFPGARGPAALWELLARGTDAISDVPAGRFDVSQFYDPRPSVPGKLNTRWGGFLEGVDAFDPFFFGIAPREATGMDPQHRVFLEVAWEAIEDAGLVPAELAGRRVGVFAGVCTSDYEALIETPAMDIYTTAGSARAVLPGRVSYALGLEGPSVAVDTACSSSLVAVHLACQSLWSGESAVALAGGVNLVLGPDTSVGFAQARMLAADGRCKAFDARGDGFVRSEGAGVVVLKPLGRALADGDPIHALIRGTAVNNDGRSGGLLMTPSRAGQEAVLREAYRAAGVSPGEVQYVEAHGTGTLAGDPVEAQALGAVLGAGRPASRPCVIGSIKTNIGHTEAAAGVAGLIKAALCLEHRAIPANLHFHEPNPRIPWSELPLVVQTGLGPWPAHEGPARAGVSSFGISGTNAHAVLEAAPARTAAPAGPDPAAHVLALSAHTPDALRDLAAAYRGLLVGDGAPALGDLCYTASVRRGHHDHRLAVAAPTREEMAERLEAFGRGEARPGLATGRRRADRARRCVFVFPGQGSQWTGMARDLLEREPAFREAIERCDRAMRAHVSWSLIDELIADAEAARFEALDVIQPVLFALQVALAAQWRAWGVEPAAVVGHSMGEMAAAHVAGLLDLDDAVRVVCRRGRILQTRAAGQGGMAVLEQRPEEVLRLLEGYGDRLAVAAFNGPTTTVVSGERAALDELREVARRRGLFCATVKIEYAPHSPLTESFLPEVREALQGLRPRRGEIPMRSTVTGAVLDGPACDAQYWVRNLREPVRFAQALDALIDEGHDAFVEISAHPLMTAAIAQRLRDRGVEGAAVPSMRRGEDGALAMRGGLGALYAAGHDVPWPRVYPSGRVVPLPAYPWQRERFWKPAGDGSGRAVRSDAGAGGVAARGLLGPHVSAAAQPECHLWQRALGAAAPPYLADHRIQGAVVLPGAAYLEMALAAAPAALGPGAVALERVSFRKALFLGEEATHTVQLAVTASAATERAFEVYARPVAPEAGASPGPWTLHASGAMRLAPADEPPAVVDPDAIRARCAEVLEVEAFYALMGELGLDYGPSFQGVERVHRRDGEALGRLRLPAPVAATAAHHRVHPALLDACFQVMAAAFPSAAGARAAYLPVGLDRLRLDGDVPTSGWGHAVLRPGSDPAADTREGDVFLIDDAGRVVVEVRGFRFQRLERTRAEDGAIGDWLREVAWEPHPLPAAAPRPASAAPWIVFVDGRGVGGALAERLAARGEPCVTVSRGAAYAAAGDRVELDPAEPAHFRRLLDEVAGSGGPACRGIAHCWSLDAPAAGDLDTASLVDAERLTCASLLHLTQALAAQGAAAAPRLFVVTAGAQAAAPSDVVAVGQAPAHGLARVIALEHPELRCAAVDLGGDPGPDEIEALLRELSAEDAERDVALRGGERLAARLVETRLRYKEERRHASPGEEAYRLDVPTPGILDGFALRTTARRAPGPGEVEIRVAAVGLNFRDVLIAMGLVPAVVPGARAFGFECAGTVAAVGPGVAGLAAGDPVIAAAPGCFGAYAVVPADLVVRRPAHLSVEEAATIPIAFLTAYYALHHLGRLGRGERVLIHAAAGGVGQAAMQIARWAGARVYATAGNPEKRELLRRQGAEHVMDSRSLDFAAEVRRATGGEGVDVVLNSLAGEFIPRSLSTLAPGGRFLEIGKVDVLQNSQLGLRQMQDNVSFSVIDLGQMLSARPARAGELFREVMRLFEERALEPLPRTVFPVAEAAEAFRYMAQARHVGKIVVSLEGGATVVASSEVEALPANATYLITGGLGGLGLTAARELVDLGARHLVLVGRSAAGAGGPALDALRAAAEVRVRAVDVAEDGQLARLLDEVAATMPPLRGVIHAAGVLDDGILLQQDAARFRAVLAPKVAGAWNLHLLTRKAPLDFFVLFSSAVSVLGSPGQGSYVAANAFLDALAHFRRAQGLPALAIDWGAWADVGMAARPERMRHLLALGILPFSPAQGARILAGLLGHDAAQAIAVAVDRQRLAGSGLAGRLLGAGAAVSSDRARPVRDEVLAADPADRPHVLARLLLDRMAAVLRCAPGQIDAHQPLSKLGIDSLMAVELKNRIESDLGVALPVVALLEGPTLTQLAGRVAGLLGGAPADASPPLTREDTPARVLARLDQLSDAEVEAMLREVEAAAGPPGAERRGPAAG